MKLDNLLDLLDVTLKVKVKIEGYIAEGDVTSVKLMNINGIVKSISVETIPDKKIVVECDIMEES